MIQIAVERTVWVADDLAVFFPGQARHAAGIVQPLEQIEQQLLAVAAADKVDFGTLAFDALGVQGGEHAAEGEAHAGVRGADLARQNFGVRITRRAQETQADEIGALLANLFDDRLVGCFGIGLVEHDAFVTGAFDDGGEGHNADRRKTHDTYIAIGGALGGWQGIKLRIADMDQENAHRIKLPCRDCCTIPTTEVSRAEIRMLQHKWRDSYEWIVRHGEGSGSIEMNWSHSKFPFFSRSGSRT